MIEVYMITFFAENLFSFCICQIDNHWVRSLGEIYQLPIFKFKLALIARWQVYGFNIVSNLLLYLVAVYKIAMT